MVKSRSFIAIGFALLGLMSCSSIKKGIQGVALDSTASVLYDAFYEVEMETNWDLFQSSVPANLKLTEALLFLRPENEQYLISAIKGYAGYAFIVNETLYLEDLLAENEVDFNKLQAIYNYSRAVKYGERFFHLNGFGYQDLMSRINEKRGIGAFLDEKLEDSIEHLEAILFIAQSIGGLIGLQKDNMKLVAQLSVVKEMFNWVCSKRPKINFGACKIFEGAYHAGRPRMLGGNPKLGKDNFLAGIKQFPKNWLIRALYMQFYLIPQMDEQGYREQADFMEKAKIQHENAIGWGPSHDLENREKSVTDESKQMGIYQALGLKRYLIIKKYEKEIF